MEQIDLFNIDWNKVLEQLCYIPESPMIFSSGVFLFLFLAFSIIYWCLGRADTLRILFVTAFSYYFYYKSSGFYFGLLAVVTVSDYFIAKAIEKERQSDPNLKEGQHSGLQKFLLFLSLFIDLGFLVYFKYTNFFGESIMSLVGLAQGQETAWEPLDIFLPVGISFFTFQSLSYTIDVYRGNLRPLNRLLDYAFYVSFFPQLVAGPIVRASDFIPQIRRKLTVTNEMFGAGVYFIMAGLFKKAVISDYISVNFVERVFAQPDLYSGVENLLAVYGYPLQIYCDFTGYPDMAIGIALMLGFQFPKNFDSPYKSKSITEFWRRWHISLSTWLKDYLYISLGGNRHGKFRQYFNLLMTMLLGGLWHGASLNFIAWGGFHGLFLVLDKMWHAICPSLSPIPTKPKRLTDGTIVEDKPKGARKIWKGLYGLICGIITFHLVCFCWIFFRNSTFEASWTMIDQMLTNFQPQIFLQWCTSYWAVGSLMLLGFILHFLPERLSAWVKGKVTKMPLVVQALIIVILAFIVIQIKSSDVQPFIYFQF